MNEAGEDEGEGRGGKSRVEAGRTQQESSSWFQNRSVDTVNWSRESRAMARGCGQHQGRDTDLPFKCL